MPAVASVFFLCSILHELSYAIILEGDSVIHNIISMEKTSLIAVRSKIKMPQSRYHNQMVRKGFRCDVCIFQGTLDF